MKKQILTVAAMLLSTHALAASDSTFKVTVQVTQGDVILAPYTTVVRDGEEFRYSETKDIDITKEVLTTADGKSKETLMPMKVGFDFRATPHLQMNGDIFLDFNYEDVRLEQMREIPIGDVDMKLPDVRAITAGSQIAVEENAPNVLVDGVSKDARVIFTIEKQ
ncbi:hypothetical protein ACSVIJ_05385 [Pseudomonas sp. NCHU5208]|uniref:hypothetical protein n=1 Tax=unclassified Pseudomonas TaxID=196821 RepID=UPI003F9D21BE